MNNDLISRDALKKAFILKDDEKYYAIEVRNVIDNAPTIDAIPNEEGYEMYGKGYLQGYERGKKERPQGKWSFDSEFLMAGSPYGSYKCSNCGIHTDDKEDNFCWNCGADMRGEDHGKQ